MKDDSDQDRTGGHCCEAMAFHLSHQKLPISYRPRFREYCIHDWDGGPAIQQIDYCPWCGKKLPESLRTEWFERLWALGLEPDDSGIPKEMLSDEWWKKRQEE